MTTVRCRNPARNSYQNSFLLLPLFFIVIQVLRQLNLAVVENDRAGVINALKDNALKLQKPTSPDDASLYLQLFKKCLAEKHFDGSELWLEDVEAIAKTVTAEAENVQNGMRRLDLQLFIRSNSYGFGKASPFPRSVHLSVASEFRSTEERYAVHDRLPSSVRLQDTRQLQDGVFSQSGRFERDEGNRTNGFAVGLYNR